jgi:hypothetical protein
MIKLFLQFYSVSFKKGLLVSFYLLRKLFFYKITKKNNFIYSRAKYTGRKEMRRKRDALKKKVFNLSFNKDIKFDLNLSYHKKNISSFEVMNLKLDLDERVFFNDFEDFEIKMAVHRFVWLYDLLVNEVSLRDLSAIKYFIFKWIDNFEDIDNDVTHESYSIGERVSSWLIFYAFSNQYVGYSEKEEKTLADSIKKQLSVLSENLEYQGRFTNNHILNNGKVFYLAGEFLNVLEWKNFGTLILKSEFDNFFLEGFFLESSSHYQMIYAKSFMEMSMVCEFGDDQKLKKWFEDKTKKILFHSDNLLSTNDSFNSMPLFGDISPDMNPNWFLGYPFSSNKGKQSKWNHLFRYERSDAVRKDGLNKKIEATPYYIKIIHLDFEIWIWLKELGLGAHGHQDNGNCVIFHKGEALVIDSGRFKYTKDEVSQTQIGVKGHFFPFSSKEEWDFMPGSHLANNPYFKSSANIEKIENDKIVLFLSSWNSKLQIKRTFLLSERELVVSDEFIKGGKFHTNLIFPYKKESIEIKENVFLIGDVKLQIESESLINGIEILDGEYSPSYGCLKRGSRITTTLESKIKYIFKINQ